MSNGCHKSRILHKDFEKKSLYDSFSGEDGSGFARIAKVQRPMGYVSGGSLICSKDLERA